MGLIYKIINNQNKKVYIGQTTQTVAGRWKQHIKAALNPEIYNHTNGMIIYNAMRKYGVDNFQIEVIEDNLNSKERLNERERYWINFYNTITPNGYNVRSGGDDSGAKEVYKIDPKTNLILAKYLSATEAAEQNNLDLSAITHVCRGEYSQCGNFKWSYVDSYNLQNIENIVFIKRKAPVYQIEFGTTNIIKRFDSISEAAKNIGVDASSISRVVHKERNCISSGGFGWCFIEDYDSYTIPKTTRGNTLLQLDKNTLEILAEFENANAASLFIKGDKKGASLIRKASKDINKSAYGYKWRIKNA